MNIVGSSRWHSIEPGSEQLAHDIPGAAHTVGQESPGVFDLSSPGDPGLLGVDGSPETCGLASTPFFFSGPWSIGAESSAGTSLFQRSAIKVSKSNWQT